MTGLAFGLSEINDYSTALPFIDWMKMSRPMWAMYAGDQWTQDHPALIATGVLDANGWPTELPPSSTGIRFYFARPADEEVDLILTYEGTGTLGNAGTQIEPGRNAISWTGSSGKWIDILATDPGNTGDYIRNIRIFRPEHEALLDEGEIFNPDWLEVIEDASPLRFMGWMVTNGSTQVDWADRPKVDDVTWALGSGARNGAPVEIMVALANKLGADPWFNMPHAASDDYIEQFATYVEVNLDAELRATVEYSNETWNFGFEQYTWLAEQAETDWGIAPGGDAWIQYSAKKAVNAAQIWNSVFGYTGKGNARLYHVLGVQQANMGLAQAQIEAPTWLAEEPGNWVDTTTVFDAIGITTYHGGEHVNDPVLRQELIDEIDAHPGDYETVYAWLTDRNLNRADIYGTVPYLAEVYADWQVYADGIGMETRAYEGGTHEWHSFGVSFEPGQEAKLQPFFYGYLYSAEYANVLNELRLAWEATCDGPYMHYVDVLPSGPAGCWGAKRTLSDHSPRWSGMTQIKCGLPFRPGYVAVKMRTG